MTVRRSKNGEYCFAFVEYQKGENGEEAVQKYVNQDVDSTTRRCSASQ